MRAQWSFGVLLWEIITFCWYLPYSRVRTAEIVHRLQANERLALETPYPEDVYTVMLACWRPRAESRPTMQRVKVWLQGATRTHLSPARGQVQDVATHLFRLWDLGDT